MKPNATRYAVATLAMMGWVTLGLYGGGLAAAQDAPAGAPTTREVEVTPKTLEGAEAVVYRVTEQEELLLHVVKPKDWKPEDKRPALVFFFGGGWNRGTPEKSIYWARTAAKWGMVGIAPDYRTRDRHKTTPMDSVSDARSAVRWVQENATKLGIDPAKVVVGGNSAGGHLAMWSAISTVPPGSAESETPLMKPAALVLFCPAADTSDPHFAKRFFGKGVELSALHQMDEKMPPAIMFHGDADKTVKYETAVAVKDKLAANGNEIELVTIPGGGHAFRTEQPEWAKKSTEMARQFLIKLNLASE